MITPQELQSKTFVKAVFGGYDMKEVDDFLDEVFLDYEKLFKENAVLKGKLKVLAEKVEEYRSVDDEMRSALLEAKKKAETMVKEAEKSSHEMTQEARELAEKEIKSLREEIKSEQRRLELARKKTEEFVLSTARSSEAFIQNLNNIAAGKAEAEIDIKGPGEADNTVKSDITINSKAFDVDEESEMIERTIKFALGIDEDNKADEPAQQEPDENGADEIEESDSAESVQHNDDSGEEKDMDIRVFEINVGDDPALSRVAEVFRETE